MKTPQELYDEHARAGHFDQGDHPLATQAPKASPAVSGADCTESPCRDYKQANDPVRKAFEAWYAVNAFDYVTNPIGSRECGLQWKSWQAAIASQPDRSSDERFSDGWNAAEKHYAGAEPASVDDLPGMWCKSDFSGGATDCVGRPSGAEPADFNLRDADLAALLPGTYYMDPPDGGDVSLFEQLRRMSMDAAKWRRSAERPSGAELPALPESVRMSSDQSYLGYTAEQMRAYARSAILAASSRSTAEAPLETLGREYGLDLTGPPDAA